MGEMTQSEKKEFYKRFDSLERSIDRILGILESDDKIKEKGLVEKVTELDRKLTDLLIREKIYRTKATTWGTIGGIVGGVVVWLLKAVLMKMM